MPALLSPRLIPLHLAGVVALALAIVLGWWQIGVWQDHRADKAAELATADPIPIDDVLGPDDAFPVSAAGRPVTVEGTWMPDDTLFAARAAGGYWVVTPLRTATGSAVLVVRGEAEQPQAEPAAGTAAVSGWIQASDTNAADLTYLTGGGTQGRADVIGPIINSRLIGQLDYDLYAGFVISQTPLSADLAAIERPTVPKPDASTSLRNLLYGIEWWVFGGFAVFIWWRWARDLTRRETVSQA